jgi:hypothetical protein
MIKPILATLATMTFLAAGSRGTSRHRPGHWMTAPNPQATMKFIEEETRELQRIPDDRPSGQDPGSYRAEFP